MRSGDLCHRRHRDRQDPVLASDSAASLGDPGHRHPVDPQVVQADRCRHNVHDRIQCPDLVEVHFLRGHAVRLGFRLRQNAEDAQCQLPGALCHLKSVNDLPDLFHPCVVMMVVMVMLMMMVVVMAVLMPVQIFHIVVMAVMRFIQHHVKITAVDARLLHAADLRLKAVSRNARQDAQEFLAVRSQVQKRRHRHIAADPCAAFQIKELIILIHSSYLRRQGD